MNTHQDRTTPPTGPNQSTSPTPTGSRVQLKENLRGLPYGPAAAALASPVQMAQKGPTDADIRAIPQQRPPPSTVKSHIQRTELVPQIVARADRPSPEDVAKGKIPVVTRQATYGLPLKTMNFPKVMAPGGWIVPTVTLEGQVGVSRGASTKTVKADTGDGSHKVGAEVAAGDLKVGLNLDPKAFAEALKAKKIGPGITPTIEVSGQQVGSVQPSFGIEGNTVVAKYDFKAQDLVWKGNTINGQFSLKFSLAFEADPKLAMMQAVTLVGLAVAISAGPIAIPVGAAFGLMAAAS